MKQLTGLDKYVGSEGYKCSICKTRSGPETMDEKETLTWHPDHWWSHKYCRRWGTAGLVPCAGCNTEISLPAWSKNTGRFEGKECSWHYCFACTQSTA